MIIGGVWMEKFFPIVLGTWLGVVMFLGLSLIIFLLWLVVSRVEMNEDS